jgi:hypothetical protein
VYEYLLNQLTRFFGRTNDAHCERVHDRGVPGVQQRKRLLIMPLHTLEKFDIPFIVFGQCHDSDDSTDP